MRNRILHLQMQPEKRFSGKLKTVILAFALLWGSQNIFAQSVGVNTNNPDPSASLEVAGTNKGLLIPRISLTSLTDKTTIPNPATALLIYNTNAGLGKTGFYYNSGTAGNPVWSMMGGGDLTFPVSKTQSHGGTLFFVENTSAANNAVGILGYGGTGTGLWGSTNSGRGIYGLSSGTGVAITASSVNGTALDVNGRIKITGTSQTPGAGKVLTSDASGNATWQNPVAVTGDAVAFSANGIKGGGSEVLANNTLTKVAFANQLYDLGNDYNDVNGAPHSTFIAPLKGIYHFEAAAEVVAEVNNTPNGFGAELTLVRTRNNATEVLVEMGDGGTGTARCYISRDVQLEIGDRVHVNIAIIASSFTGKLFVQPEISYFSGHLVVKQ